jgi:hypothetical protein
MRRGLWAFALTAAIATASHAQMPREFPPNSTLGELVGGGQQPFPLVQIGSKMLRLAAGGRIVDEHNRLITHNFLPQRAFVLFRADLNGDLSLIFILRSDELERIRQQSR